jgi:uncharacterized protein (TIGR02145 family)
MTKIKLLHSALVLAGLAATCFSQTLKSVTIGHQQWQSVNLDVSTFRNGEAIPEAKTAQAWQEAGRLGKPAWCHYQYDPANGKKFGKLYNWYAVHDSRQLAPPGWHIADASEWQTLVDASGGGNAAGGNLKERGTVHWHSPNSGAVNTDGFAARPGGQCDHNGRFVTLGNFAVFWTATECGPRSAWARHLSHGDTKVYLDAMNKGFGFAVRCVKD